MCPNSLVCSLDKPKDFPLALDFYLSKGLKGDISYLEEGGAID